jgi:hypothetical protein
MRKSAHMKTKQRSVRGAAKRATLAHPKSCMAAEASATSEEEEEKLPEGGAACDARSSAAALASR